MLQTNTRPCTYTQLKCFYFFFTWLHSKHLFCQDRKDSLFITVNLCSAEPLEPSCLILEQMESINSKTSVIYSVIFYFIFAVYMNDLATLRDVISAGAFVLLFKHYWISRGNVLLLLSANNTLNEIQNSWPAKSLTQLMTTCIKHWMDPFSMWCCASVKTLTSVICLRPLHKSIQKHCKGRDTLSSSANKRKRKCNLKVL